MILLAGIGATVLIILEATLGAGGGRRGIDGRVANCVAGVAREL